MYPSVSANYRHFVFNLLLDDDDDENKKPYDTTYWQQFVETTINSNPRWSGYPQRIFDQRTATHHPSFNTCLQDSTYFWIRPFVIMHDFCFTTHTDLILVRGRFFFCVYAIFFRWGRYWRWIVDIRF